MKSPIPQDMRGKTISNIIVVVVGILVYAAVLHIGEIWRIVSLVFSKAMPLIVGFAIAFILLPGVRRLENFFAKVVFRRKPHPKLGRVLALILIYLFMLALVAGFFAILVPQVISSLKSVVSIVSGAVPRSNQELRDLLDRATFLKRLGLDTEQVMAAWDHFSAEITSRLSQLTTYTNILINNLLAIAGSIGNSIYRVLFHALMGLIASIYLLLDRERFCAQGKKACYAVFKESTTETLVYWTRRANDIFAGFISGKLLDSLIIGVICYICMLIFGIEYPLLISVIVGVTNIIPVFGPYIGAIPSILFLLIINPLSAFWFGIFIIVLQQLDGNVIGPLILGDHVGLSAFWIMLSIVVGGGLFGFMGMLLSVPAFALIYAIARTLIDKRLQAKGLPSATDHYLDIPPRLPVEKPARRSRRKEKKA